MGLKVDYNRSYGERTPNDGNTSQRFFYDPFKAANKYRIKENLIILYATIIINYY